MKRKDYTGLRSLRGIGAILIFYHHFGIDNYVTQSFGDFGVSLFFMLSGLVLSMAYQSSKSNQSIPASQSSKSNQSIPASQSSKAKHNTTANQTAKAIQSSSANQGIASQALYGGIRRFFRKRLIKIYPLYLLSLIAAIVVRGYNLAALPLDVLLLQSWVPVEWVYFSGNSVSWFVSSLFFCYLLFLPLQRMLERSIRKFLYFFSAGLALYFIIAVLIPDRFVTGIIYIFPVMELPVFILGMLVWHFIGNRQPKDSSSRIRMSLIQMVVILMTIGFIYCYRYVDPRWALSSYWWIPDIIILTVLLISENYITPVNSFLQLKIMKIIGDISFVFYLFHTIVIALYRKVLLHIGLELPLFLSSLICLFITLVVAYLLHFYLELPLAKFLKRR